MEKVKIVTKIQTTARTVSTYTNAKWRRRLFCSTADVAVLTSRYITASRLDFALPRREKEDKQRLNTDDVC